MTGEPGFSALDPAGPQAAEILSLWELFLWVTAIVFALVVGFELVAIARGARRRRRAPAEPPLDDPLASDPRQDRRLVGAVVAATGLSVVLLVVLLVASVRSGSALAGMPEGGGDPLVVKITGHQWWWEIVYEPDDPGLRATTANELHLPVGRPVQLVLASADVIHSFWVPSLHGKKDLVPGRENATWIRVDRPGVYRGQCAEFCGFQHARMGLLVIAEPPEQFDAWLAAQREPAPPPATPSAVRGQQLFLGGPCVTCHTIAGTPAGANAGPDLTHMASRRQIAGHLPNTRGHLAGWITDPQRIKPGARMPPNAIPGEDLQALLDYLESLR